MGDPASRDPGRAYLYTRQPSGPPGRASLPPRRQAPPPHGGPPDRGRHGDDANAPEASTSASSGEGGHSDWGSAGGSVENAKVALDQLKGLIEDAVFLDEDSFSGMKTVAYYHQKLQAVQKRLRTMSQQVLVAQAQLARKDEQIREERESKKQLEKRIEDMKQELDNNSVVFNMHYNELIQRNEEIERLKAVIEGLK
eukprot:evm.model.scf_3367.2 EVM.evm.TU.scf_3367.2   scf_3367:8984-11274(-)